MRSGHVNISWLHFEHLHWSGTTAFEGEVKPSAHVEIFYGMAMIPADYDRDTSSAKLDIFRQLPVLLQDVSAATREL
jgi:hypothetical protein